MAATETLSPCGWAIDPGCCSTWNEGSPAQQARAQEHAIAVLWRLSGRQFGRCTDVIRPCRSASWCDFWTSGTWTPVMSAGVWHNFGPATATQSIELPGYLPEPTRVTVDGVDLPEAAYQVHNGRHLVRVDGGTWPISQDVTLPPTDVGTWEVEYVHGVPLPGDGPAAVGELACEFLKICLGSAACELPRRLQQLSRQGVDLTLMDPGDYLDKGRTGVQRVDEWVSTVNPHRLQAQPGIWYPEITQHVQVTWP
jgi:hypothetical protein